MNNILNLRYYTPSIYWRFLILDWIFKNLSFFSNNNIKKLIFDGSNQNEIKKSAIKNGMTPLRDAGIGKIINGSTSIEEVLRATVEDI